jgi:hypothetical protein
MYDRPITHRAFGGQTHRTRYTHFQPHSPPTSCPQVKRIGIYEVGKTLGEGTFGKVKAAVNVETGQHVRAGHKSDVLPTF